MNFKEFIYSYTLYRKEYSMELLILLAKILFTIVLIYLNVKRINDKGTSIFKDFLFILSICMLGLEFFKGYLMLKH